MQQDELDTIAKWLSEADGLLITAGAGMCVDSGLPDFRGNDGFWKAYPALKSAKLDFMEMANPSWFSKNPRLAWGFYGHRLELYRKTKPHEGFAILNRWAKLFPKGAAIFTSNVDGQFQAAGFSEDLIYECHGSIHQLQCSKACTDDIWSAQTFIPEVDLEQCKLMNDFAYCPNCGAIARPNILMFNDDAWVDERSHQQSVRLDAWLQKTSHPLVIELGAGTAIPSVRRFGELVVEDLGSRLIRINLRESTVSGFQGLGLSMGALEGLKMIDAHLE
jgi:NAD-dependent SIR2 family protein deacetylase